MKGFAMRLISIFLFFVVAIAEGGDIVSNVNKESKEERTWFLGIDAIEKAALVKTSSSNDFALAFVITSSVGYIFKQTTIEYYDHIDVIFECSMQNRLLPNIVISNGFTHIKMSDLHMRSIFISDGSKKVQIPYRIDVSLDTYAKKMKLLIPCDPFLGQ